MESLRFRLLVWQKLVPLLSVPFPALLLAISPVTESWSRTTWTIAGLLLGAVIAVYIARVWSRSGVTLDDEGMTMYLREGLQTWPYAKLLKVRQIGKYRARMCFDPDLADRPGIHMHISADFVDLNGFVDALLDRYAQTQGHELVTDYEETPQDDQTLAA